MSDSLEYDFRNYHFEVTETPRGDGVGIKTTGKDYQIMPNDIDEVQELLMNMGKWEQMLISIVNLNKDLRIFAGLEARARAHHERRADGQRANDMTLTS